MYFASFLKIARKYTRKTTSAFTKQMRDRIPISYVEPTSTVSVDILREHSDTKSINLIECD